MFGLKNLRADLRELKAIVGPRDGASRLNLLARVRKLEEAVEVNTRERVRATAAQSRLSDTASTWQAGSTPTPPSGG